MTELRKCLQCGKPHNRKKFCSNRCKDRYHNTHNPRGVVGMRMWADRFIRKVKREEREEKRMMGNPLNETAHPFSPAAFGE